MPDIAALQAWIECAWGAGFDPQGAAQLQHALQGRRTWIGTTEVATMLRYFGLRAHVVDFDGGQVRTTWWAPGPTVTRQSCLLQACCASLCTTYGRFRRDHVLQGPVRPFWNGCGATLQSGTSGCLATSQHNKAGWRSAARLSH